MSQESAEKDGAKTVVRVEAGRFAVGNPGGPGRPRRGETRAEQVRRNVDWEKADARLVAILANPKSKDADAIAAYNALNDRGWGKPLASHELTVNRGDEGPRLRPDLTADELRAALAACDAVLETGGDMASALAAPSVPAPIEPPSLPDPRLPKPHGTDDEQL